MIGVSKRGYEFSFAWIFAVIIGAVVIFTAIYFSLRLIETRNLEQGAVSGKQLATLLNPVETNLESAKTASISVRQETRIFNNCIPPNSQNTFGFQEISAAVKSGIGEPWSEPEIKNLFKNKYLFSNFTIQGKKEFYTLSKPFDFPYKVADIVMIWPDTEKYCFVLTPSFSELEEEITDLKLEEKNIELKDNVNECSPNAKRVCFSSSMADCDIVVNNNQQSVTYRNTGETVYYAYSLENDKYTLLYAAIFSNKELYECQIDRLRTRTAELASLYKLKAVYLNGENCDVGSEYTTRAEELKTKLNENLDSKDFKALVSQPGEVSALGRSNDRLVECEQF